MSATPFTAVFLMQYVYCGDPWQISASAFLANAICVGVLYYLLCALIRQTGRRQRYDPHGLRAFRRDQLFRLRLPRHAGSAPGT